jgi:ABC-2 type transport system ATP-binding protein
MMGGTDIRSDMAVRDEEQRDVRRQVPAATPAIAVQGLRKEFSGLVAVDGIDLEVRPGEFFGLLGPNGAGKTTTIGMLTTRVVPTAGTAEVFGVDVGSKPARAKQIIGVVPQSNTLDRSVTVQANLYFHGRFFGLGRAESRRRTDALLDRFRLGDKAGAMVDTLSGGMAQRLMVARALLHDPAVVFLDEPTTGLDPQSRIALWDLLQALNADGQTILLTTHYMEEADRLCDRVAIMDHGSVLALGTPAGLKRQVDADTLIRVSVEADDRGAAPTADLDRLARVCHDLDGVTATDVRDDAVRIFADTAVGLLPKVVATAEVERLRLSDITVTEPTLETVFIALTGRDLRE